MFCHFLSFVVKSLDNIGLYSVVDVVLASTGTEVYGSP